MGCRFHDERSGKEVLHDACVTLLRARAPSMAAMVGKE